MGDASPMGILDFFRRNTKATIPTYDAVDASLVERALERAQPNMARTLMLDVANAGPRKGSGEILAAYRESPWLRGVAHHVSSTVGAVPWRLYAAPVAEARANGRRSFGDAPIWTRDTPYRQRAVMMRRAVARGDLVEIQRHPWCDLMARPNPMMSGKVARQMTIASYDLVGQAGWVLDRSGPNETPTRVWPVPGTWIQRRPTMDEPTWGIQIGGMTWSVPVTDFLLFVDPDPAQPYGPGAGLGLALGDELDIDEGASKTVAAWFQNQALPNAIVALKGARPEVLRKAKSEWNNALQGFRKMYKTHFVNTDVAVQRMDTSFKDQNLVEIRKSVRDMLQQVWGVPPEKLGIVTSSNRATAQAARAIDAEDVQVPRLEMLREEYQRLAEMFDDRLIVDYESPVPDDVEIKRAVYQAFPGRFSIDEERALAGDAPLADGSGAGFLVNGVWIEDLRRLAPDIRADHIMAGIPNVNEVRARLRLPPRDGGNVATSAVTMQPEQSIDADGAMSVTLVPKDGEEAAPVGADVSVSDTALNGAQIDSLLSIVESVAAGALPKETAKGVILASFPTLDAAEVDAILGPIKEPSTPVESTTSLGAGPQQRASGLTAAEVRALTATVSTKSMLDALGPVVSRLVNEWGQDAMTAVSEAIGSDVGSFDADNDRVRAHMRSLATDRIQKLINTTTRNQLSELLTNAVRSGASGDELRVIVRGVFENARTQRSRVIAETEAVVHSQYAAVEAFRQTGIDMEKEWLATRDGRARDAHLALDGQRVPLDKPFTIPAGQENAGAQAMAPGGFRIPGQDIECRCAVGTVILDSELSAKLSTRATTAIALFGAATTEEQRAAAWARADESLRPWDSRLAKAARDGFDSQEVAVLAALDDILG
jgi:hypothetical protein